MQILQVCAYGAPFAGNFIKSLEYLEKELSEQGHNTIYAFCDSAKGTKWCKDIQERTEVYFLPVAKARILPQTYLNFVKIYRENKVDIVHTHFELYDMPATITGPKSANIFWHLHDPIVLSKRLSRKILTKLQYGIFSKRANLISVSEHYRKVIVKMGFSSARTVTVINGLDLSRIDYCVNKNKPFDFLFFGWDFYRKGSDLVFEAMKKLNQGVNKSNILMVAVPEKERWINEFFEGVKPDWLEFTGGVDDVNSLFRQAKGFISASRRETFSYAVCEAAYAGLPVITSDIPGLEWAKVLPTVKFFKSEDVNELYAAIKELKGDDYINEDAINATRSIIKNDYSLEAWSKNIIECYGFNNTFIPGEL